MSQRRPTEKELTLISDILKRTANYSPPEHWQDRLLVIPMCDGGMGSLKLCLDGHNQEGRKFKAQIGDLLLKDNDNIDVIVSLNIDDNDQLFELDIWKTNYEPTKSIST